MPHDVPAPETPEALGEPGPEAKASPGGPRTAQVALGVFICWQIYFLVAQNLFGFVEEAKEYIESETVKDTLQHLAPDFAKEEGKKGHVYDFSTWVTKTNTPWMQLTGQSQSWGLFSSGYYSCGFPFLVLLWDDTDPLTVPLPEKAKGTWWSLPAGDEGGARPPMYYCTPHEPRDVNAYFRWWQMRMRRYETAVVPTVDPDRYSDPEERADYYERRIKDHLDSKWYLSTEYMKFMLGEFKRQFPGLPPPKQIMLVERVYRTTKVPKDGEEPDGPPYVRGPSHLPLLIWHPPERGEKGSGTYQRYHAPTKRFRSWG